MQFWFLLVTLRFLKSTEIEIKKKKRHPNPIAGWSISSLEDPGVHESWGLSPAKTLQTEVKFCTLRQGCIQHSDSLSLSDKKASRTSLHHWHRGNCDYTRHRQHRPWRCTSMQPLQITERKVWLCLVSSQLMGCLSIQMCQKQAGNTSVAEQKLPLAQW